eukprot:694829-Rhodomonas_salina.7
MQDIERLRFARDAFDASMRCGCWHPTISEQERIVYSWLVNTGWCIRGRPFGAVSRMRREESRAG